MIALKETKKELEAGPLYCLYNPPMANSSHTDLFSNRQFSQVEAPQLGNSTTRAGLVQLNLSEYQEMSHANLHSISRDELLSIRRQLLQRLESSKKPSQLEATNSKSIIRKGFFALFFSLS